MGGEGRGFLRFWGESKAAKVSEEGEGEEGEEEEKAELGVVDMRVCLYFFSFFFLGVH